MKNKGLLLELIVYGVTFFFVGVLLGFAYMKISACAEAVKPDVTGVTRMEAPKEPVEVEAAQEYTNLGEYKITAYCACERCCGYYATIRPIGEDGKPIVYTASMAIAKQGVTVAADTSVHPFGTVLTIDGKEYTVQDRGGAIKGKHIDIFFESHEEAKQFGVQYKEVFMKEGA